MPHFVRTGNHDLEMHTIGWSMQSAKDIRRIAAVDILGEKLRSSGVRWMDRLTSRPATETEISISHTQTPDEWSVW